MLVLEELKSEVFQLLMPRKEACRRPQGTKFKHLKLNFVHLTIFDVEITHQRLISQSVCHC